MEQKLKAVMGRRCFRQDHSSHLVTITLSYSSLRALSTASSRLNRKWIGVCIELKWGSFMANDALAAHYPHAKVRSAAYAWCFRVKWLLISRDDRAGSWISAVNLLIAFIVGHIFADLTTHPLDKRWTVLFRQLVFLKQLRIYDISVRGEKAT